MSPSPPPSPFFRRRTLGRAASPPTWACYEQIPFDDNDDSDSASDDDMSCSDDDAAGPVGADDGDAQNMDTEDRARSDREREKEKEQEKEAYRTDVKGKQRAIEPAVPPAPHDAADSARQRRARRRARESVYALRPILTIQKSQGFVWNQDLFVPPYIKDRYIASTSPPNSSGFISVSASAPHSCLTDYEVEVVDIYVREGELDDIIP